MSEVDEVKQELLTKRKKSGPIKSRDLLSTGSTLLNLALTGRPTGGFLKGKYFLFVGDSSSGKTFLCITTLAEAANNPEFDDYRLIFDDGEGGALMDFTRFFGSKMAKRLEHWHANSDPPCTTTVEDFYDRVNAIPDNEPFIYVRDSMDSLESRDDQKQAKKQRLARESGKKEPGSYGMAKAKANSTGMRSVCNKLRETGSILIAISQTRSNVGFGAQFNPKTRAGGNALTFYATAEIWTAIEGRLKKTVNGKPRKTGILAKASIKKNRLTGKEWVVSVPILFSHGIDDIGGMIDFLVDEGCWKETKGRVHAGEFDFVGTREELVQHLQTSNLEPELRQVVTDWWKGIESQCVVERRSRYD